MYNEKKDFSPQLSIFQKLNIKGVFGLLVNQKVPKTNPSRILEIEVDPAFGHSIIKMCGNDVPAKGSNEIPVAIILWEDLRQLILMAKQNSGQS